MMEKRFKFKGNYLSKAKILILHIKKIKIKIDILKLNRKLKKSIQNKMTNKKRKKKTQKIWNFFTLTC
jgi:hypothetical protein